MNVPDHLKGFEKLTADDITVTHFRGQVYVEAKCGMKHTLTPDEWLKLKRKINDAVARIIRHQEVYKQCKAEMLRQPEPVEGKVYGFTPDKPLHATEPELSLLIVDLGESCVLKVEKGHAPFSRFADSNKHKLFPPIHTDVDVGEPLITGNRWIDNRRFSDIRSIVDALAGKPVPRIERSPAGSHSEYRLILADDGDLACPERSIGLQHADLQGLTTFIRERVDAGKDLPIYEPKVGEWEELNPPPQLGIGWELPFTAWRYTR